VSKDEESLWDGRDKFKEDIEKGLYQSVTFRKVQNPYPYPSEKMELDKLRVQVKEQQALIESLYELLEGMGYEA
jgi:hypothetical protein